MKKHVTLNDLMIFAYNEFDNKNDIKRIKQAVAKDHFLKDELEMILQTKKFIDKKMQFPRKEVLDNILNYSKALSVLNLSNIGKRPLILN